MLPAALPSGGPIHGASRFSLDRFPGKETRMVLAAGPARKIPEGKKEDTP